MIEIKDDNQILRTTKSPTKCFLWNYGRGTIRITWSLMEPGKSTLIDILTGIQSMDRGEIFINGKSIKTDKVEIRKQLGLVPQDIALLEELNAVDNLEYFGGLYGLAGAELKSQIEKLLRSGRS